MRLLKPTVHRLLMTKVAAKSLELALFCKKKKVELGAGWPDVPSLKNLGHKKGGDDNNKTTPEKKSSPEKKAGPTHHQKGKIGLHSLDTNFYISKQCVPQRAKNIKKTKNIFGKKGHETVWPEC